jgi:hypothetical protein
MGGLGIGCLKRMEKLGIVFVLKRTGESGIVLFEEIGCFEKEWGSEE